MSDSPEVLYEDAHCLAVLKPAGLLSLSVHEGEPNLEDWVRAYLSAGSSEPPYMGIVHRLDRPVTGVILWAKTPKAARSLSRQFEHRSVAKEYWAVVESGPQSALPELGVEHVWEDWLTRPGAMGRVRLEATDAAGARRAVTRVWLRQARRLPVGCSWLVLKPETGRTHQLRVQAAARGCPILGDELYGSPRPFAQGIALHARSLIVRHPVRQQPLPLVASPPSDWLEQGIELV
jgi:23S rRNA pseudouridine1911/1915/1917 synthase